MTISLDEARRFLNLARDDLAAFRALAAMPHIRQTIAFFHAQQAIEKSLKAVLFGKGEEFRRTHDLYELADRIEQAGVALPCSAEELGQMNPYAVEFRYDDQTVPLLTRQEVDDIAARILAWASAVITGQEQ